MNATASIARDTLRSFLHQKIFLLIVIFTLGFTGIVGRLVYERSAMVEANLSAQNDPSVDARDKREGERALEQMYTFFQAVFFGGASFGGALFTLVLFSTVVGSPLRRGELRSVLARPVQRSHYLLGRFAGAATALAFYWFLMSIAFAVFFHLDGAKLPPIVRYAAPLLFCKCLMMGAIALALSLVVRAPVAATLTFFLSSDWVSSRGWLYLLLPGDDRLNVALQIIHGSVLSLRDGLLAAAYAGIIALVAFCLAFLRFEQMDIT